ncbi:TIGR04552 family protein [Peredibacter sp. HCB2-198]|uniref:TIGR04552 family protein n=1 Tax=Peredibacter sp. HCB2-198 TaxID=3383025 RepID=UPI0038B567C1
MTQRPSYLADYGFNWETFDVVCSGKSSLDATNYFTELGDKSQVANFLNGYGFDISDPVESAELFGIFQEAIQFIKRYFLKEGNPEGLDLRVPNYLFTITNISELFLAATGHSSVKLKKDEELWAGAVLKVMHTLLHTDKDLRYRYFSTIQQQIFDRFYKFTHRDEQNRLFLKNDSGTSIPLYDFQTKAKKTRDSIVIKLLHKQENVAEELFDRIGVRIITYNKLDALRVIKFLHRNHVIMINNIKPSRSQNTLVDLPRLRTRMFSLYKEAIRNNMPEDVFYQRLNALIDDCPTSKSHHDNRHTSEEYRAIHFTGRQLIKYRNPFMASFNEVRKQALKDRENPVSQALLHLDTSAISRDVRFFYPFEVQITDYESHLKNTQGEASHNEYKKSQLRSAMKRIFRPIIELNNIKVD